MDRVLVVDDNEKNLYLLETLLHAHGFGTRTAFNGEQGLAMAREDPPILILKMKLLPWPGGRIFSFSNPLNHKAPIHLLLSDIVMPGIKGPQVYEKISQYHPDIKVLYMSGYSENSIFRYGINTDHADFIQKPLTVKSLLAKVASMLNKSLER
jgi:CheY-like chemotaxis protein